MQGGNAEKGITEAPELKWFIPDEKRKIKQSNKNILLCELIGFMLVTRWEETNCSYLASGLSGSSGEQSWKQRFLCDPFPISVALIFNLRLYQRLPDCVHIKSTLKSHNETQGSVRRSRVRTTRLMKTPELLFHHLAECVCVLAYSHWLCDHKKMIGSSHVQAGMLCFGASVCCRVDGSGPNTHLWEKRESGEMERAGDALWHQWITSLPDEDASSAHWEALVGSDMLEPHDVNWFPTEWAERRRRIRKRFMTEAKWNKYNEITLQSTTLFCHYDGVFSVLLNKPSPPQTTYLP